MANVALYDSDRLAHAIDPSVHLADVLAEGESSFVRASPSGTARSSKPPPRLAVNVRAKATPGAVAPPPP